MHRNIARANDCLQDEHARVREACVKILSRNDKHLERELLQADLDSPRNHDEMLLYEERLSRPQLSLTRTYLTKSWPTTFPRAGVFVSIVCF
jgi:inorganic triphosphatase YgiF